MIQDADALIGTKYLPAQYGMVRSASRTARAYYSLCPYPSYSRMTRDWKTEERGPYPRCRPFVQSIINKGATFLFGKQVTFKVSEEDDNSKLNELINDAWTKNDMTRRSRMSAVVGANSGGVFVKYSYDETKENPIQIDILDPAEQVRCYWNPNNIQELWMVRIQYPVYDAVKGDTFWHREDITDKTRVVYKPVSIPIPPGTIVSDPYQMVDQVDQFDNWEVETNEPNPFGVINGWYIKNRENGTEYGDGDLWTMYEIIDQINFNYNLAHQDNQKSIDPDTFYIDLTAADGDQPGTSNNAVEVLQSVEGKDAKQGKVERLQTNAAIRPHLEQYCKDLKNEVLSAVGSVELDTEDITNKGNLTAAVMIQVYAPLVERTSEKRQCYGEDGYCVFFERMSKGLATLGVDGWEEDVDIQIIWNPFFEETEDEKTLLANRQINLVNNGLTTRETAIREIANSDGILAIDDHIASIESESAEREAKEAKEQEAQMSQMNRQRMGIGGGK